MSDEHKIQTAILKALQDMGIFCWRNNVGRKHNLYFGKKGSCDITGILKDGRRLEIEVKDKKGKLSDDQVKFIKTINDNKGVAFVARSLDEFISKIKELQ